MQTATFTYKVPWACDLIKNGVPADPILVRPELEEQLAAYRAEHEHPCPFLAHLLAGDFYAAMQHATSYDALTIAAVHAFIVTELDAASYGSAGKYEAWCRQRKVTPHASHRWQSKDDAWVCETCGVESSGTFAGQRCLHA